MYRFDVTIASRRPLDPPQFERQEISLGRTLMVLMSEFDCSIPVGKEQLAWVADQLVGLDVGNDLITGQINITRVA